MLCHWSRDQLQLQWEEDHASHLIDKITCICMVYGSIYLSVKGKWDTSIRSSLSQGVVWWTFMLERLIPQFVNYWYIHSVINCVKKIFIKINWFHNLGKDKFVVLAYINHFIRLYASNHYLYIYINMWLCTLVQLCYCCKWKDVVFCRVICI